MLNRHLSLTHFFFFPNECEHILDYSVNGESVSQQNGTLKWKIKAKKRKILNQFVAKTSDYYYVYIYIYIYMGVS